MNQDTTSPHENRGCRAGAALMGCAALLSAVLIAAPLAAIAQAAAVPTSYVTKKGDGILRIAQKIRYPKATTNQMAYALIRANMNEFSQRTVERLLPNTKLAIPDEATVLSTDPKKADEEISKLIRSEELYKEGVVLEKQGNTHDALRKYIASAKLGHALAEVRLGQLYDHDASKTVPHDLQESIRNYQAARKQGIEIKGPSDRMPQYQSR